MFRYITTLIFVIVFSVFHAAAQPQRVIIKKPGIDYFLEETVHLTKSVSCFATTNKADFEKMFGVPKDVDDHIVEPDFDKEAVIVIAMQPSKRDVVITYTDATRAGDFMEVYCKIEKKKYPLSYEVPHVCVGIIPKYKDIKKVRFYDEGRRLLGEMSLK